MSSQNQKYNIFIIIEYKKKNELLYNQLLKIKKEKKKEKKSIIKIKKNKEKEKSTIKKKKTEILIQNILIIKILNS